MQAMFGEHKSTKLFHEFFAFDEFLTSTNSVSNRYVYPVCPAQAGPSIIPNPDYRIQVTRQGGQDCPLRGLLPQRSFSGSLVESKCSLIRCLNNPD